MTPLTQCAEIKEEDCIGCARCLPACPFDAIVGAPQQMHTVLAAECTGCRLCVAPCPVDCIVMRTIPAEPAAARHARAAQARRRYEARNARQKAYSVPGSPGRATPSLAVRKAVVAAAIQRVQAKRTPPTL